MTENKDRQTNMAHSSVNAPPKKDGAGGSYVWGSAKDVTDYEPQGVGVTKVGVEKSGVTVPASGGAAEAYVHDESAFPALGGSGKSPAPRPVAAAYTKAKVSETAKVSEIAKVAETATVTETESSPEPVKQLTPEVRQGKLKDVRKEGGKLGVDIEGASHMGNTMFFCAPVVQPGGDLELTVASVNAMNAPEPKVVRAHMERTGCSGNLGKIIVSSNADQIAVVCYIPKALQEQLAPLDWLQELMDWYGGEVVEKGEELCTGVVANLAGNGVGYEILLRHRATDILQKKKLMAQADHAHDGDEEVFGDEDLPGISEARRKSIYAARQSIMQMRASVCA